MLFQALYAGYAGQSPMTEDKFVEFLQDFRIVPACADSRGAFQAHPSTAQLHLWQRKLGFSRFHICGGKARAFRREGGADVSPHRVVACSSQVPELLSSENCRRIFRTCECQDPRTREVPDGCVASPRSQPHLRQGL